MQKQAEKILQDGLKAAISDSGSVIIVNPNNGQIKALANYPSYNPADFQKIEDAAIFTNPAVSSLLEPGSIMKPITLASGLDSGSVSRDQTYYDPSFWKIGDATVRNVEEDGGASVRSMSDILQYSLNTGATWLLMQMGGGELNQKGREVWYDYLTNHFGLGKPTGIEQGYEEPGYVADPVEGYGLNIQYANSSFGQGILTTPLQMAMAISSLVNGGVYYQPTLVAGKADTDGNYVENAPKIINDATVSKEVSSTLVEFMQVALLKNNFLKQFAREGYIVGGKTGTAEIANPAGGYYEDRFNGTYVGFVGGDKPEYVIMVSVNEPKIGGYAGTKAAGPIFGSVVTMLIDNFSVQAKSGQ
jgi:cell division protein FtsI/penicillin-binding protein 2